MKSGHKYYTVFSEVSLWLPLNDPDCRAADPLNDHNGYSKWHFGTNLHINFPPLSGTTSGTILSTTTQVALEVEQPEHLTGPPRRESHLSHFPFLCFIYTLPWPSPLTSDPEEAEKCHETRQPSFEALFNISSELCNISTTTPTISTMLFIVHKYCIF